LRATGKGLVELLSVDTTPPMQASENWPSALDSLKGVISERYAYGIGVGLWH